MLRLKRVNTSPPGGFGFKDAKSGWATHSWSFNATCAAWYQELRRRHIEVTVDAVRSEVETYICRELMKLAGWEQWVIFDEPKPEPILYNGHVECNISTVIPVYRPTIERLGKCLEAVSRQVNEIIVVADDDTHVPDLNNKKCRLIRTSKKDSGYGAKANIGAKHATSEYVWLLNDDCYPNPDCGTLLLSVLTSDPKIAAVGHLLRDSLGSIVHGGTKRGSGATGFIHRDVGLKEGIKSVIEQESVTGASMLLRKEAFNDVGGFFPGYHLYLEDSDLCLSLRKNGWRVYYTPFAEAIHDEGTSTKLTPKLNSIIQSSLAIFKERWGEYLKSPEPVFEPETQKHLVIDVVYVHLIEDRKHEVMAEKFVESALAYPAGEPVNWIIACNSTNGNHLSDRMKGIFNRLGNVAYFKHDDSGWDIGAYQAYCKISKASFVVFLGGTAYCRRKNWIVPMADAFRKYGDRAIYGACGNMGNLACKVFPHIRTTGFWCAPSILNRYPTIVRHATERYPFEHGPNCFTQWAWSQGIHALVVDADGIYTFPNWDRSQNGYHQGNQSALLIGDRITMAPYYPVP